MQWISDLLQMELMLVSLEMSYWHILKSKLSQSPFYSSAQQLSDQSLAALPPFLSCCIPDGVWVSLDFQELETRII